MIGLSDRPVLARAVVFVYGPVTARNIIRTPTGDRPNELITYWVITIFVRFPNPDLRNAMSVLEQPCSWQFPLDVTAALIPVDHHTRGKDDSEALILFQTRRLLVPLTSVVSTVMPLMISQALWLMFYTTHTLLGSHISNPFTVWVTPACIWHTHTLVT